MFKCACHIPLLIFVTMSTSTQSAVLCTFDKTVSSRDIDFETLSKKVIPVTELPLFINPTIRQDSTQEKSVDVEQQNASIVLERMQLEIPDNAPLMYCLGNNPFTSNCPKSQSVRSFMSMTSNDNGRGTGSCESKGNGRRTIGYLDPFHYHINLNTSVNFDTIRVKLANLQLSKFSHINTVNKRTNWDTLGQAGDNRMYVNGTFNLTDGSKTLISAASIKWYQNTTYPLPVGSSPKQPNGQIAAYFVGRIVEFESDERWVNALDPFNTGYLLGVVRAYAIQLNNCYSTASYWITLRGYPDLTQGTQNSVVVENNSGSIGAKIGAYRGSNTTDIKRAKDLADDAVSVVTAVMGTVMVGSVALTAVAITLPAASLASVTMPGNGGARMIRNAQFVARLGQIRGFHTDSFSEYGNKANVFLVKFPFPFGKRQNSNNQKTTSFMLWNRWMSAADDSLNSSIRQEDDGEEEEEEDDDDDDDGSITDEIFKGCAFYTFLIVLLVLTIHAVIWIFTRHRRKEDQVAPHAWMVYIFSLIMEYVHTSSILNAGQYIRTNAGNGTGKPLLYTVAIIQLLFIGLGFVIFFIIVIVLASKRLKMRNVNWIPKTTHPDPIVRKSALLRGEYQAEDDNFFHGVFEGYYSGLAGPRIWLAVIEMFFGSIDTIMTAIVWNEIVVLSTLVVLYGVLLLLFMLLGPFVDTLEGRLVMAIALIELILLFLEFLSALGTYETAETMDNITVVLSTLSIVIGALITLYCDVIPISITVWQWSREWVFRVLRGVGLVVATSGDSWSEWSVFSESTNSSGSREGEERLEALLRIPMTVWRRRRARPWEPPVNEHDSDEVPGESNEERQVVPDQESTVEPPPPPPMVVAGSHRRVHLGFQ